MSGRGSKLFGYVDWRIRVVLSDTRSIIGTLMAFDKHMNLVLAECEEIRKIKTKENKQSNDMKDDPTSKSNQTEREEKRPLGLVMIRGETVIALAVISPPKAKPKATVLAAAAAAKSSAGVAVPMTAGRGVIPVAAMGAGPIGLTGPVRGVGGPMSMTPSIPLPPMPPMPMPPGSMPQFMPQQFAPQYGAPGFPAPPGRGFAPMPMPPMPMQPMPMMPMPMGRGYPPMPMPPGLPPQQ